MVVAAKRGELSGGGGRETRQTARQDDGCDYVVSSCLFADGRRRRRGRLRATDRRNNRLGN